MEAEKMSSILTQTVASDSRSLNSPPQNSNKHNRPSSRFKGVVYQQNGHIGAQVYGNSQRRIWLGTYKTKMEAAIAYDSAAMKLLNESFSRQAHRNFPMSAQTMHEPDFQAKYTTEQVLNMIKNGSYQTRFSEFLLTASQVSCNPQKTNDNKPKEFYCEEFFRKQLTLSDVRKLNRFVIPKRYAMNYFPISDKDGRKCGVSKGKKDGGGEGAEMELTFYDNNMKSWNFKYCYWKSSETFVLTRGWFRFVKAKGLEVNDIVVFYKCEMKEKNVDEVKKFWMIEIEKVKGFKLFGVQIVSSIVPSK